MNESLPAQWSVVEPGVLRVVYSGHIAPDYVRAADAEMMTLLARHPETRAIIVDTAKVAGFSAAVGEPSKSMMLNMKSKGVRFLLVISPSAAIRMFGATMALFSAVKVKFFEHESEALAFARKELAAPAPQQARR